LVLDLTLRQMASELPAPLRGKREAELPSTPHDPLSCLTTAMTSWS